MMHKKVHQEISYDVMIGNYPLLRYNLQFLNSDGTGQGHLKMSMDNGECTVEQLRNVRDQLNEILDDIDNEVEPF